MCDHELYNEYFQNWKNLLTKCIQKFYVNKSKESVAL